MVEFLQMLFQVLRVEDLASQYSNPLDQFLYVVFFPSIFIILIIYIIAHQVAKEHMPRGFSMLLGVAMYVFIIVWPPNEAYSLYSAVAPMGQAWFILIIILVGIWAIFRTFFPGGGGGAPGGAKSASGLGSQLAKAAWHKMSGKEDAFVKSIETQLDIFEKMEPGSHDIGRIVEGIKSDLNVLYGMTEVGGMRVFNDHQKLLKRFENIAKRKKAVI